MPIPIVAIMALVDAAFKVTKLIADSKDIDPADKKKLVAMIKEAQDSLKPWNEI